MRDDVSRNALMVALLCAGLGIAVACGAGGGPPPEGAKPAAAEKASEPAVAYEVEFEAKSEDELAQQDPDIELRPYHKVKAITVRRGEGIRFIARNLDVWILIPDGKLEPGSGGTDWTVTDSYIAFRIDKGNATVVVPADYPESEHEREIFYSVLVEDGVRWDYIHGDSPPRMIIPPTPSG